ncbi:ribosome maturation factor RimM [bacterium]|nr:ribosome maturation factor RimM [bacterium]
MSDASEYITVGRLGRTRGVNGEIYITPLTDFPDRFLDLKEIFVEHRGVWERFEIRSSRLIGGRPVLGFANILTLEDAARLTNRHVAVRREEVVELPEGSYYIFDLVGCTVVEAETDRTLGEVVDVRQYPANDAYLIRTGKGPDVLFPAVRQFIRSIDVANKRIVIDSAGLFDEV